MDGSSCDAADFAGLLVMPQASRAATCNKSDGTCSATITTNVFTGQPTILCQTSVVAVSVQVNCGLCATIVDPVLRCAESTQGYVFITCGLKHVVKPAAGKTWADTLTDCNALVYDVAGQ